MRTLYIDCTSGVCADMFISGFRALGVETEFMPFDEFEQFLHEMQHHLAESHGINSHTHITHGSEHDGHHHDGHNHEHFAHNEACHSGGSSYQFIKNVIRHLPVPLSVRDTAEKMYKTIALAEAEVHGADLETVHFHEVGRPRTIYNVITIAMQVNAIKPDKIVCSAVHDGCGTIECSHGIISVPVPAVKAMMKKSDFIFVTDDVETEMVTPSGLGVLIGMGASPGTKPNGSIIAKGLGYGGRDTGRSGMEIYLIDEAEV